MSATEDGRRQPDNEDPKKESDSPHSSSPSGSGGGLLTLRRGIVGGVLGLALALGLNAYKDHQIRKFSAVQLEKLDLHHPKFKNLFQASFYFFYQDQFLPGIRSELQRISDLHSVQYLSTDTGEILFDSLSPASKAGGGGAEGALSENEKEKGGSKNHISPFIRSYLRSVTPQTFTEGYEVQVLVTAGQYAILYHFDHVTLKKEILTYFVVGSVFIVFFLVVSW